MPNLYDSKSGDIERKLTLCLLSALTIFLIPLTIYRFLNNEMIHFAMDVVILTITTAALYSTWHQKKLKTFNYFSVIIFMTMAFLVIYLKGFELAFWVFPVLIGTYFLLASTPALLINIGFVIVNVILLSDVVTQKQTLSFYPCVLLVCIFGYISSKRNEFKTEQLLKLVTEDPLTGINNRRRLDERLQEILANNSRTSDTVSMLLLDLDFFKHINDTYGHKQGDQILIDFAHGVKTMIRGSDAFYRFGGEEFVVIANSTNLESAGILAESIRKSIVQNAKLSQYSVTVSIGVAEILDSDNADSWFRRADRALYESKNNGRNRVTLANPDENTNGDDLISSKKIKPISSKTHSLIRQKEKNAPNHHPKDKQDTKNQDVKSKT